MEIFRNGGLIFTATPDGGEIFTDRQCTGEGAHLGHGMVEYAPGKVLAFVSRDNGDYWGGHNGTGYTETKTSEDGGKTWSEAVPFPYSKTLYDLNLGIYAACEKAVLAKDGTIIQFNLISDLIDSGGCGWEPYGIPTYLKSRDGGKTWSEASQLGNRRGRIYDARVFGGDIYVLIQQGKDPCKGTLTEYHMYKSTDCGESFGEISTLPFPPALDTACYYGTMSILHDGRMIVYVYYDREDETRIKYSTSGDMGKTWSVPEETRFAKRIRNLQLIAFENSYFCFGRSGSHGEDTEQGHIIVYCSADGINWDEGHYLKMRTASAGAYSNAIIVHDGGRQRVLYHASHAYYRSRTNVHQWFIDAVKE